MDPYCREEFVGWQVEEVEVAAAVDMDSCCCSEVFGAVHTWNVAAGERLLRRNYRRWDRLVRTGVVEIEVVGIEEEVLHSERNFAPWH